MKPISDVVNAIGRVINGVTLSAREKRGENHAGIRTKAALILDFILNFILRVGPMRGVRDHFKFPDLFIFKF